jgi:Family of unknown function (DUF6526)
MPDQTPQNFANHAKFDPPFHFFLAPMSVLFILYSCIHLYRHPEVHSLILLAAAITGFVALFKLRLYPLRVQDRVIRLEERLRLATLLPENLRSRIGELSEEQLIGLRFASDAELPALAQRALNEKLSRKDIKAAVTNWRPDYFRI